MIERVKERTRNRIREEQGGFIEDTGSMARFLLCLFVEKYTEVKRI